MKETITAIATPQGIGALAVIRISGKKAVEIFEKISKNQHKAKKLKERYAHKIIIYEKNGKIIDEVIAIKYNAPKTYTGEDLIEIISHGGYFTVKKIIEEILKNGARLAEKGEFTKRAFLNGKIGLMKAEAINALIESKNQIEHNVAIKFYSGENINKVKEIEEKIKEEISFAEAEIEFGDENKEIGNRKKTEIQNIIEIIDEEIKRINIIETNKNGIEISIVGPTNAGKSSLFNHLLGYNRSIVNKKEGTTRDKISETIEINGKEVVLNDTAGIRETEEEIEKIGQKITEETIKETQILIWITDGSEEISKKETETFQKIKALNPIVILNKIDLKKDNKKEIYYTEQNIEINKISLIKKTNVNKINEIIQKRVKKVYEENKIPFIFFNKRQKDIAIKINYDLKEAEKRWAQKEIVVYYLNKSIEEIEKITGKIEKEQIINKIFQNFCVGK
jgi:tRNA modification GTPase